MNTRLFIAGSLLILALWVVCFLAGGAQAQEEAKEEVVPPAPHFSRIGVYEFDNVTKRKDAGKEFSQVLFDRLANKFEDTEFIYITPEDSNYPEGPVLLKHAQRLGEKYDVEAIIDGRFLGYRVTGGKWPNKATTFPEVAAQVQVRVVETSGGTVFDTYSRLSAKPRVYSQRLRTAKDLWKAVIRDIVDEVAKEMEEDGLFYEEREDK